MRTMNRLEQPFRGATTLQEQINRVFGDVVGRAGEESNLTPWAPSVDIYETENELVVKADLPDVNPQEPGHPRGEQHPHDPRRTQV